MSDEILRIENGVMKAMTSKTFRDGFLDKTLEDGLHELIENYPGIIPGRQISSGSDDPPRFLLLCREMSVGGWSLDFLLVDQFGVPTLLEAKLVENPESRRAVIGQIIEYAANAADNWLEGKLFEKAASYYAAKDSDLEEAVKHLTGNDEITTGEFFESIENNLKQGKMRLIIATDNLRPEVRKIIEYLNAETRNIEIFGLEISLYEDVNDPITVLVPTLIGQSQLIAEKKQNTSKKPTWHYQRLIDEFNGLENPVIADRLKKIATWAYDTGHYAAVASKEPVFGVQGKYGLRLFTFYLSSIYCFLNAKHHNNSTSERDNFVAKLNELSIFQYNDKDIQALEGRTAPGKIEDLSNAEFDRFMEILNEVIS